MADDTSTIIVIGAGILGLTAALSLQQEYGRQRPIVIVARDFPVPSLYPASINYASMWAGAHYRPAPEVTAQDVLEATLARRTHAVLVQQAAAEPEAGITFLDGIEYLQAPSEAYQELRGRYADIDGFRRLEKAELPEGVTFGVKYRTWCINTPVYCAHLLRKFVLRGGKTVTYSLASPVEAFYLQERVGLVVNCSGVGFGDPKVFITRGQTCLVSNPCNVTITQQNADGTWTFLVPRGFNGGTIVGGTKQPHDWSIQPLATTREQLLSAAAKMYPPILNQDGGFDVITDVVGRRPTREGGIRLEVEQVAVGKNGDRDGMGKVVHAYGVGGMGYELSWGVAERVVEMVRDAYGGLARPRASL